MLHTSRFLGPLVILVAALCAACGPAEKDRVFALLVELKKELQVLESSATPGDQGAEEMIAYCRNGLQQVDALLVEDEYGEALIILEGIAHRLQIKDPMLPNTAGPATEFLEIFGQVEYQGEDGDFRRLNGDEDPRHLQALKVGFRSGLIIKPFPGCEVSLQPRSQVKVLEAAPAGKQLRLELERGELLLNKMAPSGRVAVLQSGFVLVAEKEALVEMKTDPLSGRRFTAVHGGEASWREGGDSGVLEIYEGMSWQGEVRTAPRLPLKPSLESPPPKEFFVLPAGQDKMSVSLRWSSKTYIPRYQVQVSDSRHFFSRFVDDSRVEAGSVEVSLPKGSFFWRVRGLSDEQLPGPFTEVRTLEIGEPKSGQGSRAGSPVGERPKGPRITNLEIKVINTMVIVSGRTRKNAKVNVNGVSAVMLEEGNFRAIVTFNREGEHDLRVLAIDPATGAETVEERRVSIQF